jgi:ribose transport system permease protein
VRRVGSTVLNKPWSLAFVLTIVLFAANVIRLPNFVAIDQLPGTFQILAPFVIAAVASTPSILSGGGGIDLSIGPIFGVANALIVVELLPRGLGGPAVVIPVVLVFGALVGLINGLLVTVVRLQPIVATLGMYLILTGVTLQELPQPIGTAPGWINDLGGSIGPIPGGVILMAIPILAWLLLMRTAFQRALLAVGGDDRAAFSAGVNIRFVRLAAYTIGGGFAGLGGIALTAFIQSGDANIAPQYTLIAIAAVALGGTSLAGGRGGILGSVLGATSIYLVQNVLAAFEINAFWVQVVSGLILVGAVVFNSVLRTLSRESDFRFARGAS